MVSIPKDNNRISVIAGTLNSDGETPQPIYVVPTTHTVRADNNTTGAGDTTTNIQRDDNRATTIWGVSSADGVTPVAIWADSSGILLICDS